MILLIDIGNTRIKIGFLPRGHKYRTPLIYTLLHPQARTAGSLLTSYLNTHYPHTALSAAVGVTVASDSVSSALTEQLADTLGLQIQWLHGASPVDRLVNGYDAPEKLGADRWLAMAGVADLHATEPVLLATFGTATTVDALVHMAQETRFIGGLILPGPALMRQALTQGTARLPEASSVTADFPSHTHQAIWTGIAAAQAGAVCRQFEKLWQATQRHPHVVCSGGGWHDVQDETHDMLSRIQLRYGLEARPVIWREAPVLDGLARYASSTTGNA